MSNTTCHCLILGLDDGTMVSMGFGDEMWQADQRAYEPVREQGIACDLEVWGEGETWEAARLEAEEMLALEARA